LHKIVIALRLSLFFARFFFAIQKLLVILI
jgi:hypothetical protein